MSRSIEDMIAEVNERSASFALQVMEMFPELMFPADCIDALNSMICDDASMDTLSTLVRGFYNAGDYSKVIEIVEKRCGKRFLSIVEQRMYTHACFEVNDFVKAKKTFTEFGSALLAAAEPEALVNAGLDLLGRTDNKLNQDYSLAYLFEDIAAAASLPGVDDADLKAFKAQVKDHFYIAAKYHAQKWMLKSAELAFSRYADILFALGEVVDIAELVEKAVKLPDRHSLDATMLVLNCIDRIADNAGKAKIFSEMSSDTEQHILQGRMHARFKAVQHYYKEEDYEQVLSLASHDELVKMASGNKDLKKALFDAGLPGDELVFKIAYAFYKTGHCEFIPNIPCVRDVDSLTSDAMLGFYSLQLHAAHKLEADVPFMIDVPEEFFTQASELIKQWKPKDAMYKEVRKEALVSIKDYEARMKEKEAQTRKEARAAEKARKKMLSGLKHSKLRRLWRNFTSGNVQRRLIIGSAFLIGGSLAWLYGGNIITYVAESVDNNTEEVVEGDAYRRLPAVGAGDKEGYPVPGHVEQEKSDLAEKFSYESAEVLANFMQSSAFSRLFSCMGIDDAVDAALEKMDKAMELDPSNFSYYDIIIRIAERHRRHELIDDDFCKRMAASFLAVINMIPVETPKYLMDDKDVIIQPDPDWVGEQYPVLPMHAVRLLADKLASADSWRTFGLHSSKEIYRRFTGLDASFPLNEEERNKLFDVVNDDDIASRLFYVYESIAAAAKPQPEMPNKVAKDHDNHPELKIIKIIKTSDGQTPHLPLCSEYNSVNHPEIPVCNSGKAKKPIAEAKPARKKEHSTNYHLKLAKRFSEEGDHLQSAEYYLKADDKTERGLAWLSNAMVEYMQAEKLDDIIVLFNRNRTRLEKSWVASNVYDVLSEVYYQKGRYCGAYCFGYRSAEIAGKLGLNSPFNSRSKNDSSYVIDNFRKMKAKIPKDKLKKCNCRLYGIDNFVIH